MGPLAMVAQNLTDYQWKNRLLLLVDTVADTKDLTTQEQVFSEVSEGILERDLLVFQVTGDGVYQNGKHTGIAVKDVYADYKIPRGFKGVLLIGKDGGVKLRENFVVKPQTIFGLIDGMPMRKAEMRSRNKY